MKRTKLKVILFALLLGSCFGAQAADDYRITNSEAAWPYLWEQGNKSWISPSGIAVDMDGNVYVSVAGDAAGEIQVFSAGGELVTRICSTIGSGNGQCRWTQGVSIGPDGMFYVSDDLNRRIQKFSKSGSGSSLAFSYDSEFPVTNLPRRTAFSLTGDVYVAHYWGGKVNRYGASGGLLQTFPYSPASTLPLGVTVDSQGNLYVSVHGAPGYGPGDFIDKYDPVGSHVARFGSPGTGDENFMWMGSIAIDKNDILYAADSANHRIQVLRTDGTFLGWYGKGTVTTGWHEPGSGEEGVAGTGLGEFNYPVDVTIDKDGYPYVTEDGNDRVQKLRRNKVPLADAGPNQEIVLGESVTLDGSGSGDQDGTIVSYAWDFGDGTGTTGVNPSHTYAAAGTFTVNLTVTDNCGAAGSDTVSITVITPAAASSKLKADVVALPLPFGATQSLTSKLDAAIAYLDAGQITLAMDVLKAFMNFAKAQKDKQIPAATADALIAEATRIMNTL